MTSIVGDPAPPCTDESYSLARASASAYTAAVLAAVSLSACGGGGGSGDSVSASTYAMPDALPGRAVALASVSAGKLYANQAISNEQAARFLLQAGFVASDSDITQVRSQGYATWLELQIAKNQGVKGWDWLNAQGYANPQSAKNYYDSSSQADYMVWNQLITCTDTLRKRAALALSEYMVVSVTSLDFEWRSHGIAHYWDTLCTHALGNFRDLLEAITLNPAMGYFLNTKGNQKENAAGRQPDENYAREVMQLFTIGLQQLNMDGTVKVDGSGNPLEAYTAADVSNLARVFTGYDVDMRQNVSTVIAQTGGGTRSIPGTAYVRLPMQLTASRHSTLAATFLGADGASIAANTAGATALRTALDALFNHLNTAPFFAKQMIQRLVTSNPSPAYVQRVAQVFVNNGAGVRGDLAYVFSAILLDDEARNPASLNAATAPEFGKLREPVLRFVQWARTFGAGSSSGLWRIYDMSDSASRLGQSPLRAPSVFNFFRPGYVPPSTVLSVGAVAPEFQIVTESSVGAYLNFMRDVLDSGLRIFEGASLVDEIKASYTAELALVTNAAALVDRLNLVLCAGQLSVATRTLLVNALNATAVTAGSSATLKRQRVCAAVLMVMASAEYLIQK